MIEPEKVLDFETCAKTLERMFVWPEKVCVANQADRAADILRACTGLTLKDALSRLRCKLSPADVVERLESLYDEDFRSDWQYGIKQLIADLTAPKEG